LHKNRDLVLAPNAQQGRRLALVIGNDTYPATPLKNARHNARAMHSNEFSGEQSVSAGL